jgi:hypothetical protein
VQNTSEGSSTLMDGWNTICLGMLDTTHFLEILKRWEYVAPLSKLISVNEIFQDINR